MTIPCASSTSSDVLYQEELLHHVLVPVNALYHVLLSGLLKQCHYNQGMCYNDQVMYLKNMCVDLMKNQCQCFLMHQSCLIIIRKIVI